MHVAHLSLHDFRSYAGGRGRARARASRRSSAATARARPTWSRRSTTSPRLASHRVATDAPLVRPGAEQAVVRAHGRARRPDRRSSRSRSTRAGPTGPGSTARRCPAPARCSAWCARCCSRPRTSPWSRATRPSGAGSSTTCWCCATPRLAGVRADYDRVLKQRNALLKTAGAARARVRVAGDGAVDARGLGRPPRRAPAPSCWPRGCDLVDDLRPLRRRGLRRRWRAAPRATAATRLPAVVRAAGASRRRPRRRSTEALLAELERRRSDELDRGVSLVGPHRDELLLRARRRGCRRRATPRHGESWSFALALRLASYDLLARRRRRPGPGPRRRVRRARHRAPRPAGRAGRRRRAGAGHRGGRRRRARGAGRRARRRRRRRRR